MTKQIVKKIPTSLLFLLVAALLLLGIGVALLTQWQEKFPLPIESKLTEAELLKLGKINPYPFLVLSNAKNLNAEISYFMERVKKHPNSPLELVTLAGAYLKMARVSNDAEWYRLAEETARQSLKNLSVSNQGAKLILADVAQARHRFPESIQMAQEVLKENPHNADALAVVTTAYLGLGNIAEADHYADLLVKRMPRLVPLTLRAMVNWNKGQERAALLDFQRAALAEDVGETESSAWMRTLLARIHLKRGRHDMARDLLKETLRFRPDYPLALELLAELETKSGNYPLAEKYYSEAFQISHDLMFQVQRAHLKKLQGEFQTADQLRNETEQEIRKTLTNPYGHPGDLAELLLDRGRPQDIKEAITLYQQEAERRQDPETLKNLAQALGLNGRWSEARQIISQALQWGIRDAAIFYEAAQIEKALNNPQKAKDYLLQALEADPTINTTLLAKKIIPKP